MNKSINTVLAIETSCDETAVAIVQRDADFVRVLSSAVSSQADTHSRTRGVVPEVAARAHAEALPLVIDDAIQQCFDSRAHAVEKIDTVAVTEKPGLVPALVTGRIAARALATAWNKRLIGINHLAGHIAATWLMSDVQNSLPHAFPTIALLVSGGHTELYLLDRKNENGSIMAHHLGGTRDDAAGEAFDKIARVLSLPYPGGPALSALAKEGDSTAFAFPRPMIRSGNLDMSFSGLKTAIKNHAGDRSLTEKERADVAASAQEAICDVLVTKTVAAVQQENAVEVILSGGVAANEQLRNKFRETLKEGIPFHVPHMQFCTDNAAMIGAAALLDVQIVE